MSGSPNQWSPQTLTHVSSFVALSCAHGHWPQSHRGERTTAHATVRSHSCTGEDPVAKCISKKGREALLYVEIRGLIPEGPSAASSDIWHRCERKRDAERRCPYPGCGSSEEKVKFLESRRSRTVPRLALRTAVPLAPNGMESWELCHQISRRVLLARIPFTGCVCMCPYRAQ